VLYTLRDEFTHYDLDPRNVLLYEIPQGKYVTMVYHLPNEEGSVTFRTKYIVKIIDYGRCHFNNAKGVWPSSQDLYDTLQETQNCTRFQDNFKGEEQGYTSFDPHHEESHFINSKKPNRSHDLIFAYLIGNLIGNLSEFRSGIINTDIYDVVLDKVQYKINNGTPEVLKNTYKKPGDNISNVTDMFHALKTYMEGKGWIEMQKEIHDKKVLGTMKIWLDRSKDMEFTGDLSTLQS
jgi:hypothetical protein